VNMAAMMSKTLFCHLPSVEVCCAIKITNNPYTSTPKIKLTNVNIVCFKSFLSPSSVTINKIKARNYLYKIMSRQFCKLDFC
jgi:hypothetical protein